MNADNGMTTKTNDEDGDEDDDPGMSGANQTMSIIDVGYFVLNWRQKTISEPQPRW